MKTNHIIAITVVLVVGIAIIAWLRQGGFDYPGKDIRKIIPFMRGKPITIYDFGGVAMILLGLWGWRRLHR